VCILTEQSRFLGSRLELASSFVNDHANDADREP
jgi:hypothetical protein